MLLLIAIGLLGGLITGVSPCVLPVLPIVFFAGGTGPNGAGGAGGAGGTPAGSDPGARSAGRLRRPALIILGLVASFSVFTLLGSALLSAVGLPQSFLRWAGLVVLVLVGLGPLFPPLERVLERPFQRLPKAFGRSGARSGNGSINAFVLGLGVGTLYVPCAGPVLAAISIAGSSGHISGGVAVLTVAFAVGVAVPLFVFALAGGGASRRIAAYRRRSSTFRIAGGAVMVLLAIALTFNLTDGLQRAVPAYTQALQDKVEDNSAARAALAGLAQPAPAVPAAQPAPAVPAAQPPAPASSTAKTGTSTTNTATSTTNSATSTPAAPTDDKASGPVVNCVSHASTLANCGPAPQIVGISSWLNTPADQPLTLAQLHGKVVLVNFWTFSCINCQRTLPYIKAWYAAYHASGLEIIAVHTPEFSYEHELGNVKDAVSSDGITYPVALDNTSSTWRNYDNAYWPAQYLVDAQGVIRHVVDGEGGYADSERLIRQLLRAADPDVTLPAPTNSAVTAGP